MPPWLTINRRQLIVAGGVLCAALPQAALAGLDGVILFVLTILLPYGVALHLQKPWPLSISAGFAGLLIAVNTNQEGFSRWFNTAALALTICGAGLCAMAVLRYAHLHRLRSSRAFLLTARDHGTLPFFVRHVEPHGAGSTINGFSLGSDVTVNRTVWGHPNEAQVLVIGPDRTLLAAQPASDLYDYFRQSEANGESAWAVGGLPGFA